MVLDVQKTLATSLVKLIQLGGNILSSEIHKITFGNKEEFSKQWKECA